MVGFVQTGEGRVSVQGSAWHRATPIYDGSEIPGVSEYEIDENYRLGASSPDLFLPSNVVPSRVDSPKDEESGETESTAIPRRWIDRCVVADRIVRPVVVHSQRRRHNRLERKGVREAGSLPYPQHAPGTDQVPEIDHFVVVMMENHSFDNILGLIGRGDGFTLGSDGRPDGQEP